MAAPVLLVHDDIATIASVRRLLAREGYEVILATSAADALIGFGHHLPGLIILAPSVESGRGYVVLEELAQHPDGKLARVLLLGESIPGYGAPVAPLPLDGQTFLQLVQEAFRAAPDAQGWQVADGDHLAPLSGEWLTDAPEPWRAAAPPEVDPEQVSADDVMQVPDEDWSLIDPEAEERTRRAEAAAQAAIDATHQEVEAEAIAAIDSTLAAPSAEDPAPSGNDTPVPTGDEGQSATDRLESDLEALEDEIRAEAAERRRQRAERKAAGEAAHPAPKTEEPAPPPPPRVETAPEAQWFDDALGEELGSGHWAPATGREPLDETSFADLNEAGAPAAPPPEPADTTDEVLREAELQAEAAPPEAHDWGAEVEVPGAAAEPEYPEAELAEPPESSPPPEEETPESEVAAEREREEEARRASEEAAEREREEARQAAEAARREAEATAEREHEEEAERAREVAERKAAEESRREAEEAAEREREERAREAEREERAREAVEEARRQAEEAAEQEIAEQAQQAREQAHQERLERERLAAEEEAEREAAARAKAEAAAQAEIERLENEREAARAEAALRAQEAAAQEQVARRASERAEALAERERSALAVAAKAREAAEAARRETDAATSRLKGEAEQVLKATRSDLDRAEKEVQSEREARARLEAELSAMQETAERARGIAEKAARRVEEERKSREQADAAREVAEEASRQAEKARADSERARVQAEEAARRAAEEAKVLATAAVVPLLVGRDSLKVPMGGAVDLAELAGLVVKLCRARVETRLELKAGDALRTLWLQRGSLVGAASTVPQESLLDRARRDGLIGREQEAEMRLLRSAPAAEMLDVLKGGGLLREAELVPLVQRHAEQIALEALSEADSVYRLAPEPPPSDVPFATSPRTVLQMLTEALRRALDADELLSRWGGLRAVPTATEAPVDGKALGLSDRERRIIASADGEGLLEDLLRASGMRQEAALKLLGAAQILGLLRVDPPEERTEEPSATLSIDRLAAKFDQIQDGDYFSILGLPRSAGGDEVQRAYAALAAEFHPLKFAALPDPSVQHRARQVQEALVEAAHVLQDDRLRKEYARHLVD
jgi:CheY-like chemotaxis protein